MNWRRIGLIAAYDLQHSLLKAKGLLFLVSFLLFWFFILRKVDSNVSAWFQSMEGLAVMSMWLSLDMARKLFVENSPIISAFFIINLIFLPFFTLLAGYDQFSSELSQGYFRFLSTRCKRSEIFLAKYLSSLSLMMIGIIAAGIACVALSSYYEEYAFSVLAGYFAQSLFVLFLYSAAMLAFMSIVSVSIKSAVGSLILGGVAYVSLWFSGSLANAIHGDTEVFSYILPSALKPLLIDFSASDFMMALMSLPLYLLVYGMFAWTIFKHRNF